MCDKELQMNFESMKQIQLKKNRRTDVAGDVPIGVSQSPKSERRRSTRRCSRPLLQLFFCFLQMKGSN